MASSLHHLSRWQRELLEGARVAHLGLLDDADHPRVLPVTFALQGGCAWSAIDEKPKRATGGELARVRYLRRRPEAALTVDSYDEDWARLAWVQLLGPVTVVPASDARSALDALAAKYDQYRLKEPPGPLLRLEPRSLLAWRATSSRDQTGPR